MKDEDKIDVIQGLFDELKVNAKTLQGLIMDGLNAVSVKTGEPDLRLRLAYLRVAIDLYKDSKKDVFSIAGKYKVKMENTVEDLYRAFDTPAYSGTGRRPLRKTGS